MHEFSFEFDVSDFDLYLPTNTLTVEASQLKLSPGFFPQWIYILMSDGSRAKFVRGRADWADATQEDIAGWNYSSDESEYRLLIIND